MTILTSELETVDFVYSELLNDNVSDENKMVMIELKMKFFIGLVCIILVCLLTGECLVSLNLKPKSKNTDCFLWKYSFSSREAPHNSFR